MEIEILRKICLSFPAVTEDVKWESNLCFCIGGKIFCIANLEPPHTFSFKVRDEEFDEVIQTAGFVPAPYLAKAKWIMVTESARINSNELKNYLLQSYELIKVKLTRKQRKELGLD
jgi:predicted DNA-binding protein (MmcQ/YjbR family)